MNEMDRLQRLILEKWEVANKFGRLYPLVLDLINYIYAELSDEDFEAAVDSINLTVVRTFAYSYDYVDKLDFSKVRVYSDGNYRYGITGTKRIPTGIHVTIIGDGKEINLIMPNDYQVLGTTELEMMIWANTYLYPITVDDDDIKHIYENISGFDVSLERLAFDVRKGLTLEPLKGFIRFHKDKIPDILETCKKHEWSDLTMVILREIEESGIRDQVLDREFRL